MRYISDKDIPSDLFERPILHYSDGTARYDLSTFTLYTSVAKIKHAGITAALHEMTHWTQQIGTNALGFATACACIRDIICIEMFNDFRGMPYVTTGNVHSISLPTGARFFMDDFGFFSTNNNLLSLQKNWRDLFLAEKYTLRHLRLPAQSALPSDLCIAPVIRRSVQIIRDAYPNFFLSEDSVVEAASTCITEEQLLGVDIQGDDIVEAMTLVIEFNVARIGIDQLELSNRWARLKETSYSKAILRILEAVGAENKIDNVVKYTSVLLHVCDIALATALPPFDDTNTNGMSLLEIHPGARFGSVIEALRRFGESHPKAGLSDDVIRRNLHEYLSDLFKIKIEYSESYLNSDSANILINELGRAEKELEGYDIDISKGHQFNLYFKYFDKIDRIEFLALIRSLFLRKSKLHNTYPLWQLWMNPLGEVMSEFGFPPIFNNGSSVSKQGFTRSIREWLFKAALVSYPLSDIALGRASELYPLVDKIISADNDTVTAKRQVAIVLRQWLSKLLATDSENIILL